MAADDLSALSERLARLEARERILELKYRYLRACDAKDIAGFRACFVDGRAELDYGPLGVFEDADALTEVFARAARERGPDGYRILDMHHAVHPSITLDPPDQARGRWSMRFRQIDREQGTETTAALEYDDHYVRRDDDWRIRGSRARTLWALVRPLPDDAVIWEAFDG